ncbi:MAG: cation transporter [Ignisphaera sp.]
MSLREISARLREGYRVIRVVLILSLVGMIVEFLFAYSTGSMILYTDFVHWAIDASLEFMTMIALYLASKTLKRFSWGILYLESFLILITSISIISVYIMSFVDYVNNVILNSSNTRVTTLNPLLSLVTLAGGFLTLYAFLVLKKEYVKSRLEILKSEYIHALIDIVASAISSAGVVATALTRSPSVELLTIVAGLFFALHSIVNVIEDSVKSIIGVEGDKELKYDIMSEISGLENVRIKNIDVRKIGSFYIVTVDLYVDPSTTLIELNRLRTRIIRLCRGVSEMIYHVDVIFRPDTEKYKSIKKIKSRKR